MILLVVRASLWLASIVLLTVGAGTDLRNRIIPNEVVLLVAAGGLVLGLVSRPELAWVSLLVSVVLFVGLATLVHYNVLGGGDAKLIAAVTLLVPPDRISVLLMDIALAGGMLSGTYLAAYLALKRAQQSRCAVFVKPQTSRFNRFLRHERARIGTGRSVPYALAILGGVSVYVVSELYQCLFATSCSL